MNSSNIIKPGLEGLLEAVRIFLTTEHPKHIKLDVNETLNCDLQIITHPVVPSVSVRLATPTRTKTRAIWRTRKSIFLSSEQWDQILKCEYSLRLRGLLEYLRKQDGRSWITRSIPTISPQDFCTINQTLKIAKLPFRFYQIGATNSWDSGNTETFTVNIPDDQTLKG